MNRIKTCVFGVCLLLAGMAAAGPAQRPFLTEEPTSPQPHVDCYWNGYEWVCSRPATS